MKKIFLILFVICIVNKAEALVIQNVTITNNNAADINIKVNVADGYVLQFYNSNYTINQSIIVLNICYSPFLLPTFTFLENDFVIADIASTMNNYTLIVNCYKRRNTDNVWTCTSLLGSASTTLQFQTPLTNPISLANITFENSNQKISIFPNPITTTFQMQNINLKEVSIIDNFGRLVKEFLKPQTDYNISDLSSGIYYVNIKDISGNIFKEKLIKK